MTGQSKLLAYCSCKEFQHPWTEKCFNASAGLIMASTPYCLKMYTMVYLVSLLMRCRKPKLEDLQRTFWGIIQSSFFLITNAYQFIMYNCLLRKLLGCYYFSTVAFWPCLLASYSAIVLERPQRRTLLSLYVANVATETMWNMMKARGLVKSLRNGQVLIYGVSLTIFLYLYRLGLHKVDCKDSIFDVINLVLGKNEEGPLPTANKKPKSDEEPLTVFSAENQITRESQINIFSVAGLVQMYSRFIGVMKSRHSCCPHRVNCLHYAVIGGLRSLLGGIGLEVALKIAFNVKHIIQLKTNCYKNIFNRKTLQMGLFLGSFSFLYKIVSCSLRHIFQYDDARFAIPAGLIGSVGFVFYPNTTIALYIMWKMLQIVYNLGIKQKILPRVPYFTIILYSVCTAVLFHAGIVEPRTLRQSYYKFLEAISGQRLSKFNMTLLDVFGYGTSMATEEVKKRLHIVDKSPLPKYSLAAW